MKSIAHTVAVLAGILFACHLALTSETPTLVRAIVPMVGAAVIVGFGGRHLVETVIAFFNNRSPRRRRWTAVAVLVLSYAYFVVSAIFFQRSFHPTWHDDQMHAVQTAMLAKGYLWHSPHPLPEFFETFHVFMTPVYAPIHFPGTAIMNVLGVWLGLGFSVLPLLYVSLGAMMAYLLVSELLDGVSGVLAAMFVTASPPVRMLATMETSHNVMIFLGAFILWTFLRWRDRPSFGRSAALGFLIALAGFTRPVDALAYAIPVAVAVLIVLWKRRVPRSWAKAVLMVVVGLPLVALQLAFDKAVTGRYLDPPYAAYNDVYYPFINYGDAATRSRMTHPPHVSDLPQKQVYYEQFLLGYTREFDAVPLWRTYWDGRLPSLTQSTVPGIILIAFIPLGVFGLRNLRRWVVVLPPWVMLVLYVPHAFYFAHYGPVAVAGMALLALLGITELVRLLEIRWSGSTAFVWAAVFLMALIEQSPFTLFGGLELSSQNRQVCNYVYEVLPRKVQQPALVFCRIAGEPINYHDEPVYNTLTAWIDDSPIVLAQSLGAHNIELVRYYSKLGQNRTVYELNRNTLVLKRFGTVDDILQGEDRVNKAAAVRAASTQPTTSITTPPAATRPQE